MDDHAAATQTADFATFPMAADGRVVSFAYTSAVTAGAHPVVGSKVCVDRRLVDSTGVTSFVVAADRVGMRPSGVVRGHASTITTIRQSNYEKNLFRSGTMTR